MKKILPLTFTILVSAYASSVCAEDSWYFGALYNAQESSRDFNTAGVIVGFQYNNYLALETRFSTGTSGYSSFYGTPEDPWGNYSEDIDTQAAILLKASYPIFDSFKLYGLAGYTKTKLETNGLGQTNDSNGNITGNYPFKHTESENGFSYGLGLNYEINAQFSIFIDYQVLPDFEPNSSFSKSWKSTTIGANYSF
ncbi:outer membrane beta-barrel protein [Colwellia sp. TT2012]|uniref:outer membrane beta-barrel protein n=1 Tax=Colwellia sp. TT2012 TaxID=1720342 RepID=UPI00070A4111|nr:outer membrane beta-barrel protein [Colwellia sp. TT2012]